MIKNYGDFILESKYEEIEKEYHSIGEYIESVSKDNEYLLGIISNYISDIDTDIRISNAVNLLKDFDKEQLLYRVYNYLNRGEKEKEKESDVMTNIVFESLDIKAGKNIFVSFLKSMTALGLKNISKLDSPYKNYIFFYKSADIGVDKIKSIFSRFKSLSMFLDLIDYTHNTCSLYYGIKSDLTFEYGFFTDKIIPFGEFKLNKSNLNWLLLLQSPSAMSLKKDIISLDLNKLSLISKIATEMKSYNLNSQSKSGPDITDGIITFGYYGIGKWDNGVLDAGEYENLKSNFKTWLMKYKWSEKIMVNISYNSYWIYFNIKIK